MRGNQDQGSAKLQQYDVQRIIDERKVGKQTLYLVKWVGYSHQDNTWQPYSHLKNAPDKLREWKKRKTTINYSFQSNQGCQQYQDLKEELSNKNMAPTKTNKIIKKAINISNKHYSKTTMKNYQKSLKKRAKVWEKPEYQRSSQNSVQIIQNTDKMAMITNKKMKKNREWLNHQKIPIIQILQKQSIRQLKLAQKYSTTHSNHSQQRQSVDLNFNKTQQRQIVNTLQKSISHMNILNNVERVQQSLQISDDYQNQVQSEDQQQIIYEQSVSDSSEGMQQDFNQRQLSRNRQMSEVINIEAVNDFEKQNQIPYQLPIYESQDKSQEKEQENNAVQMREIGFQQNLLNQYESVSEIPIIQNIMNQNITTFFQQPVVMVQKKREPEYAFIVDIVKIFKQNGIGYCSVLMRDQTIIQKISFQVLERQRPDVVLVFLKSLYDRRNA